MATENPRNWELIMQNGVDVALVKRKCPLKEREIAAEARQIEFTLVQLKKNGVGG